MIGLIYRLQPLGIRVIRGDSQVYILQKLSWLTNFRGFGPLYFDRNF